MKVESHAAYFDMVFRNEVIPRLALADDKTAAADYKITAVDDDALGEEGAECRRGAVAFAARNVKTIYVCNGAADAIYYISILNELYAPYMLDSSNPINDRLDIASRILGYYVVAFSGTVNSHAFGWVPPKVCPPISLLYLLIKHDFIQSCNPDPTSRQALDAVAWLYSDEGALGQFNRIYKQSFLWAKYREFESNRILMNTQRSVAFVVLHELGHIVNSDFLEANETDAARLGKELRADNWAIDLLIREANCGASLVDTVNSPEVPLSFSISYSVLIKHRSWDQTEAHTRMVNISKRMIDQLRGSNTAKELQFSPTIDELEQKLSEMEFTK